MMDKREARKFVRELSDADLILLAKQAKEEQEHRRQVSLARYRSEVEQLWAALVEKVSELDKLGVSITATVDDDTGSRYIHVTDHLKADGFMVCWHASAVYESEH